MMQGFTEFLREMRILEALSKIRQSQDKIRDRTLQASPKKLKDPVVPKYRTFPRKGSENRINQNRKDKL